jgi:hypothetical protein
MSEPSNKLLIAIIARRYVADWGMSEHFARIAAEHDLEVLGENHPVIVALVHPDPTPASPASPGGAAF